ncbi:MAG TPA: uroporphyrinogen decarboxylase [Steroidobacteraceae bacterium]|nr:uroporphyrinogen decarboxylase [Steroidobacteraceae bacterium]
MPFDPLKNDVFLRALMRQPTDRTPVWMMRQAGRYLPEYRATRGRAGSFLKLCMNPEMACEVTLQPLDRFPLDAAILFSDILTIPHAMGLGLEFETGEGPVIRSPVRRASDVARLKITDPSTDLRYVTDAVTLIRRELHGKVPLIGFAGSPWTVGTYIVEGGSSKQFDRIKGMMYEEPATLHKLLDILALSTIAYLNAQIAAGAQAVMIFDTWGGVLSPASYREFSLRYMEQVLDGLTRENDGRIVPRILFTKGGGAWLTDMAATNCDALGVDWTTDLSDARISVDNLKALQGNLDPSALYASPAKIRELVGRVLASYGNGHGHVFNLGHGIHPDVLPEHAAAMIAAVHELSPQYHR